ncbi:CE1759 family FMN reductase [Bifidobacterium sp.]|uniref:CE1759 family FMN reductase n=1 Tax=Bifidobacterium sp. TaxID=41200 RepID=UPI0025C38857|nr:CE1759 family FMN reductase [Bifidobacterium sp.]MCH4209636.1 NAD(P)H-dependent oxidoreductase [Bifidobacterium sp.]
MTDTCVGNDAVGGYGRYGRAGVSGVAGSAMNRVNHDTYRITVISAGVSEHSATGRLGDGVAMRTQETLRRHGYECELRHIDLKDFAADIAVAAVNYHMTDALLDIFDQVTSSDALIAATPVFKASYSGLFKSFWDIVDVNAIMNMPVALVATGGSRRHALVPDTAMRSLFAFLRAIPTPTSVLASGEDWGTEALESRLRLTSSELAAMAISGLRGSMTAADADANAMHDEHAQIPVR